MALLGTAELERPVGSIGGCYIPGWRGPICVAFFYYGNTKVRNDSQERSAPLSNEWLAFRDVSV